MSASSNLEIFNRSYQVNIELNINKYCVKSQPTRKYKTPFGVREITAFTSFDVICRFEKLYSLIAHFKHTHNVF